MDFLKEVLGEDFDAFKKKLENFNEKSEKPLKLANLSEGGYVSREKYDALCGQMEKLGEESIKPYKEEIEQLCDRDNWMKPQEAIANGFIDLII